MLIIVVVDRIINRNNVIFVLIVDIVVGRIVCIFLLILAIFVILFNFELLPIIINVLSLILIILCSFRFELFPIIIIVRFCADFSSKTCFELRKKKEGWISYLSVYKWSGRKKESEGECKELDTYRYFPERPIAPSVLYNCILHHCVSPHGDSTSILVHFNVL